MGLAAEFGVWLDLAGVASFGVGDAVAGPADYLIASVIRLRFGVAAYFSRRRVMPILAAIIGLLWAWFDAAPNAPAGLQ